MSAYENHSHTFGQDQLRSGERRTAIVMLITAITMVVEISGGVIFGSMALLADGLHMGSHAVALGINVFAYRYARRHAQNPDFSFGTGKVNALGGFTGALLLAGFAVLMAYESIERLLFPVEIAFTQAIVVAVVGLIVNGVSLLILHDDHDHAHGHDHHHHGHDHDHDHDHDRDHEDHEHHHAHDADAQPEDHNLLSAYLHVLADTLTSVLAIVALLAARYLDWIWFDPVMGLVGTVLVARWSWGLCRSTARVLLDYQAPDKLTEGVRSRLEHPGGSVVDLHVWSIAPGQFCVVAALETQSDHEPEYFRERLLSHPRIAHVSIELNRVSPQ